MLLDLLTYTDGYIGPVRRVGQFRRGQNETPSPSSQTVQVRQKIEKSPNPLHCSNFSAPLMGSWFMNWNSHFDGFGATRLHSLFLTTSPSAVGRGLALINWNKIYSLHSPHRLRRWVFISAGLPGHSRANALFSPPPLAIATNGDAEVDRPPGTRLG